MFGKKHHKHETETAAAHKPKACRHSKHQVDPSGVNFTSLTQNPAELSWTQPGQSYAKIPSSGDPTFTVTILARKMRVISISFLSHFCINPLAKTKLHKKLVRIVHLATGGPWWIWPGTAGRDQSAPFERMVSIRLPANIYVKNVQKPVFASTYGQWQ